MNQDVSSQQDPNLLIASLKQKAIDFRTRVLAGEVLSDDEVREALICIRQQRKMTLPNSRKAAAPSAPARPVGELLGLFGKKPSSEPEPG